MKAFDYDLIGIGELLVDFTESRTLAPDLKEEVYTANPGGAPANLVCTMQTYGLQTAFIGSVGDDHFGRLLIHTLDEFDVDTSLIQKHEEIFTTLAFVTLDETGDREFSFARKPGADTGLELDEKQREALHKTQALHFGTISLSHEPSKTATQEAISIVRDQGGIVSFDPNLRLNLWESKEDLLREVYWGFKHCDILKLSLDDLVEITKEEPLAYAEKLLRQNDIQLILLSIGAKGAYSLSLDRATDQMVQVFAPALEDIKVVDTTGAGDIFTGSFLSKLLPLVKMINQPRPIDNLQVWLKDRQGLEEALTFANRMAGLSTTKPGGIPAIPSPDA